MYLCIYYFLRDENMVPLYMHWEVSYCVCDVAPSSIKLQGWFMHFSVICVEEIICSL